MRRRTIGPTGPEVSQLCFGTMRLRAIDGDGSPADHLNRLHDAGVDTLHSSFEYDSHELFLDALAEARRTGRRFKHIVKLAEPSFDHTTFDGARLRAAIDRELTTLGTETITCVQWLVRTKDPQADERTIGILTEARAEIDGFFAAEIAAGRIGSVATFPYTVPFAEAGLDLAAGRTLAVYLNLRELDYVDLLDRSDGAVAIRPFAGGELTDSTGTRLDALRFPLQHPKVATVIVSATSAAHLAEALAVADLEPDLAGFEASLASR